MNGLYEDERGQQFVLCEYHAGEAIADGYPLQFIEEVDEDCEDCEAGAM